MRINTISAYETTAEKFFGALESWDVDLLLDTRLKNTNQLAGFTKKDDLAYFVPKLLHADYVHDKLFAPAPTMLERYLHGNIGWDAYADAYREDIREREAVAQFYDRYGEYKSVCLLGTAAGERRRPAWRCSSRCSRPRRRASALAPPAPRSRFLRARAQPPFPHPLARCFT